MNITIRITTHDDRTFEFRPQTDMTMARAVVLSGAWPLLPLCSGLGKCGLCAVRYLTEPPSPTDAELKRFSESELTEGMRLSCLHPACDAEIELPEPPVRRTKETLLSSEITGDIHLSVDLGTTSIHWQAEANGEIVGTGSDLNPQMGLGSEVISRLAAAQQGFGPELSRLVKDRLKEITAKLPARPTSIALAGNSAMTMLLMEKDISGLASAPYSLDYAAGEEIILDRDLPPVYLAPLLSPFVGGDLSAGMAALLLRSEDRPESPEFPLLLADMGTNGEFVLALSEDEFILTSVPMGPALEGVGLSQGKVAEPGAVVKFTASPSGLVPSHLERPPFGGERPGISGTGYLSLLSCLFSGGLMDENGRFIPPPSPMAGRLARSVEYHGEPALQITAKLVLPASDVEETLKVKAAFNLAFSELLEAADLKSRELKHVFLAGAMGEHVDITDLEGLGFMPSGLAGRTTAVGNTSLQGAAMFADDETARNWAEQLRAKCRVLDLAGSESFNRKFVERMVFNYVC